MKPGTATTASSAAKMLQKAARIRMQQAASVVGPPVLSVGTTTRALTTNTMTNVLRKQALLPQQPSCVGTVLPLQRFSDIGLSYATTSHRWFGTRRNNGGSVNYIHSTTSTHAQAASAMEQHNDDNNNNDQTSEQGRNFSTTTPFDNKNGNDVVSNASSFVWDVPSVLSDIQSAARYQEGETWDYETPRRAVKAYTRHLQQLLAEQQARTNGTLTTDISNEEEQVRHRLVDARVVERALKTLLRCKLDTPELAVRVREMEKLIGAIGRTTMTELLSLRLVEANGKAGNIGRTLSLLELRQKCNFEVTDYEFIWAVNSIDSATATVRVNNNHNQVRYELDAMPATDNPTRWLDAILVRMHQRGVPLTTEMANRMLETFASTGHMKRQQHAFYTLRSREITRDNGKRRSVPRIVWCAPAKLRHVPHGEAKKAQGRARQNRERRQAKSLQYEESPGFSAPLAAAFAFVDSLTHGACGHDPIDLNIITYNQLLKICVYRGALTRALNLMDNVIPNAGLEPSPYTYNIMLEGLSRVGDMDSMMHYFLEMTNKNVPIDTYTVSVSLYWRTGR